MAPSSDMAQIPTAAEATLSLDAALAYARARKGENAPSAAESSRDSSARAEREGDRIRVTWETGTASAMARYEGARMAEERAAESRRAIARLEAKIEADRAALDALERSIAASGGPAAEADLAGAREAHASYVRSVEAGLGIERARLELALAPAAVPEDAAPVRSGEHRLPASGPVTLRIV